MFFLKGNEGIVSGSSKEVFLLLGHTERPQLTQGGRAAPALITSPASQAQAKPSALLQNYVQVIGSDSWNRNSKRFSSLRKVQEQVSSTCE